MGFDWKGYYAQAEDLCTNHLGGKEAALRSACSRYYYAAFHKAVDHQVQHAGFKPQGNGNDHGAIITHLAWTHAKTGRDLDALRHHRNDADYIGSLSISTIEAMTKHAKSLAAQIIAALP